MTDNGELNQMKEPAPRGPGGGGSKGWIGLIGSLIVVAIIIGMFGEDTTVEVFGLGVQPTLLVLIAYIAGVLSGRFRPVRR
ncbi:hypothetical protein [Demequina sp. NBRC 110056]|uniref:hypothetical protein n=1 Tax=Demequina sp. NBRC 110056 TaxID=1570345 RepID=UPI000A04B58D|nr:hypothetical protein [Demequina sp. NBRC 110056]